MARRGSEPLLARLLTRIARQGPLSVADYMAEVLTNPQAGYYTTGEEPFGAAGDFVTAPEISQMFGEILGLWMATVWRTFGAPQEIQLIELGPGRGTLMADLLRAGGQVPGFLSALRLHLVEVSRPLRAKQAEALAPFAVRGLAEPTWHDDLGTLPEGPALVIANEFFDALPIRQFERTPQGWCERLIAADETGKALRFGLSAPNGPFLALLPPPLRAAPLDSVVEISPQALSIAAELGRRVATYGGAGLVIDYGRGRPDLKPSLQALSRHRRAEVLEEPGTADLTAHVDFPLLAGSFLEAGARCFGPVGQGCFLTRLGIRERAQRLIAASNGQEAETITAALERLTGDEEMGRLFKVLGFAGPGEGAAPGFEAKDVLTPATQRGQIRDAE